jgi:hypothetical protein
MFQLTRNGPVLSGRLDPLRDRFATEHCVVLRNMLVVSLLEKIQRNIERAQWHSSVFTEFSGTEFSGTEFTLEDPFTVNVIDFLLNDPGFLDVIRGITDCKQISEFSGRVYRMAAGHQHHLSWHNDLNDESRRVGFSMNLSMGVFRGGGFALRNRLTKKLVAQVNNTGFGDAILFRISRDLEHRVSPVMEGVPKTACAGWFLATGKNYTKGLIDRLNYKEDSSSRNPVGTF